MVLRQCGRMENSNRCAHASRLNSRKLLGAGHSLGGALATLAAIDLKNLCKAREQLDVTLYTFGAPRTGNHPFAWDLAAKVNAYILPRLQAALLCCFHGCAAMLGSAPRT